MDWNDFSMAVPVKLLKKFPVISLDQYLTELHKGPIVFPLHVDMFLFFYSSGLIWQEQCVVGPINHVAVAVGYGFSNKYNTYYLILRNNWGKYWGDQGYFYLQWFKNGTGNPCNCANHPQAIVQPLGDVVGTYETILARKNQQSQTTFNAEENDPIATTTPVTITLKIGTTTESSSTAEMRYDTTTSLPTSQTDRQFVETTISAIPDNFEDKSSENGDSNKFDKKQRPQLDSDDVVDDGGKIII